MPMNALSRPSVGGSHRRRQSPRAQCPRTQVRGRVDRWPLPSAMTRLRRSRRRRRGYQRQQQGPSRYQTRRLPSSRCRAMSWHSRTSRPNSIAPAFDCELIGSDDHGPMTVLRCSSCMEIEQNMIDQVRPPTAELSNERRLSNRRLTERRAHQATATATACPRCGSHYVGRSATRWWERPLRWVTPLVPFRCRTCEWRGWRRAEWLQIRPAGGSSTDHDDRDVDDRSERFTRNVSPRAS